MLRAITTLALICLCAPAMAEREVHVVGVIEGTPDPDDRWRVPVARVHVDRPGHDVTLVLVDHGPVRWEVDLSPGTRLEQIALGGFQPEKSELFLGGIPMPAATRGTLPLAVRPVGRPFRELVAGASALAGRDQIDSFLGVHTASGQRLTVRSSTAEAVFAVNHPEGLLSGTGDLPAEITDPPAPAGHATFDVDGVTLTEDGQTRTFRLSHDIGPAILPVAAVYAPEERAVFAMAIGGEGWIYRLDLPRSEWSVLASLDGYDGAGIIHDSAGRRLVITGAFARPGDIRVLGLDGGVEEVSIPVTRIPALTDLYDHGNVDAPTLRPTAVAGDWVRLEATASDGAAHRIYALNLDTREIRLIDFVNGW